MKFKLFITTVLATVLISTTAFAKVNEKTLNIISSEKENSISNGYEISNKFKIFVNENEINLKNGVLIFSDRTYMPIRELSSFLNANINYDAKNKVSILSKNNVTIEIPQNRTKANVIKNGISNILNMDSDSSIQSLVLDGVTYLPLRFIAENLDYDIIFDTKTKTIKLNKKSINNSTSTTEVPTETTTQTILKEPTSFQTIIKAEDLYVGNKDNNKLHKISCRYVDKLLPENIVTFKDRKDAISSGYTDLCEVCKP